jgi:hypothetical protein
MPAFVRKQGRGILLSGGDKGKAIERLPSLERVNVPRFAAAVDALALKGQAGISWIFAPYSRHLLVCATKKVLRRSHFWQS